MRRAKKLSHHLAKPTWPPVNTHLENKAHNGAQTRFLLNASFKKNAFVIIILEFGVSYVFADDRLLSVVVTRAFIQPGPESMLLSVLGR